MDEAVLEKELERIVDPLERTGNVVGVTVTADAYRLAAAIRREIQEQMAQEHGRRNVEIPAAARPEMYAEYPEPVAVGEAAETTEGDENPLLAEQPSRPEEYPG